MEPAPHSVRWRASLDVHARGLRDAYGHGPFRVVVVIDHSDLGIPPGVIIETPLGFKEVNLVWLEPAEE